MASKVLPEVGLVPDPLRIDIRLHEGLGGYCLDSPLYPGHWSWIYVARNDPRHDDTSIWEWMATTKR